LSLSLIRIVEEEALKENTGRVEVQVPVDVATYMLNEKRKAIAEVESQTGNHILIIASTALETPQYRVERIRKSEMDESSGIASYKQAEVAEESHLPDEKKEKIIQPERPAVASITPGRPKPPAKSASAKVAGKGSTIKSSNKGILAWLVSLFTGGGEKQKPAVKAGVRQQRTQRNRGGRNRNQNRNQNRNRDVRPAQKSQGQKSQGQKKRQQSNKPQQQKQEAVKELDNKGQATEASIQNKPAQNKIDSDKAEGKTTGGQSKSSGRNRHSGGYRRRDNRNKSSQQDGSNQDTSQKMQPPQAQQTQSQSSAEKTSTEKPNAEKASVQVETSANKPEVNGNVLEPVKSERVSEPGSKQEPEIRPNEPRPNEQRSEKKEAASSSMNPKYEHKQTSENKEVSAPAPASTSAKGGSQPEVKEVNKEAQTDAANEPKATVDE
jgi:ribonuclease E